MQTPALVESQSLTGESAAELSQPAPLPLPFPPPPGMSNKTWTTTDEHAFLVLWVQKHKQSQEKKTLAEFWPGIYAEYFSKFDFAKRCFGKSQGELTEPEATVVGIEVKKRKKVSQYQIRKYLH
jgi:hypothetical protein